MPFTKNQGLVTTKFKVCVSGVLIGLAAISVPLAFTSIGSRHRDLFKEEIKEVGKALSVVPNFLHEHFLTGIPALKKTYEDGFKDIEEKFDKENGTKLVDEWKKGRDIANDSKDFVKSNAEEVNYYLFVLGNFFKPLVSHIPTILKDTAVYNEETRKDQQLLSIQKAIVVYKQTQFKEFINALKEVIDKHLNIVEKLSKEEGRAIVKILREVREEDFDKFMQQVKNNANKAMNKNYTNTNDLLKDIFVGEDEITKLRDYVNRLKVEANNLKDNLGQIEGLSEEQIKLFNSVLEELEKVLPENRPKKDS